MGLTNIRNALGQILEYAYLDDQVSIEKLIIIGPVELKDHEKIYLNRINQLLAPDLEYWAYLPEQEQLKNQFLKL
mgnify:CR=1 FL=1